MKCSPRLQRYFDDLEKECKKIYAVADKARKKNKDPQSKPEISLAKKVGVIRLIVNNWERQPLGVLFQKPRHA